MYTEEKKVALRSALVNQNYMIKQQLDNIKQTRDLLQSRTSATEQNILEGCNKTIGFLFYLHELNTDFHNELKPKEALSQKLDLPDECPFLTNTRE